MGMIESMKNAIKGTSKWLRSLGNTAPTADGSATAGNTTAARREARLRNARYAHISVPMMPNPLYQLTEAQFGTGAAKKMGLMPFTQDVEKMPMGKGITLNKGVNAAKRRIRELGKEIGLSRKCIDSWAYDEVRGLKQS
jgi:hypothetical protein